jgi:hypothetical protein
LQPLLEKFFASVSNSTRLERHRAGGAYRAAVFDDGDTAMQYMLLIYQNENDWQTAPKAEIDRRMAAYRAYTDALIQAGVMKHGSRLQPIASATTVRLADGKTNVLNGPYAETREQLGGYYLIDVPDLDRALSWASRCPGASLGAIEVRPLWTV